MNSKNRPRQWRQLNLEPKVNEHVLDEIEKTNRQIMSHEEWLAGRLKPWDSGVPAQSQFDKLISQFCEMVYERQARLHELAAASYFLAERRR